MKINFFRVLSSLLALLLLIGCSSEFSNEQSRPVYDYDEDGDPVIVNPPERDDGDFGNVRSYCYGISTPQAPVAIIDIPDDLPLSYDLSDYLPPVGSQGTQGSCVGWATGYYLKSLQENMEDESNGIIDADNLMSPAYIYNQIKAGDCQAGSSIQDALQLLFDEGVTDYSLMPYDENDCSTLPTQIQKQAALENRIESFAYLDSNALLDQTKAFLNKGQPIVIAVAIDNAYFGARDDNGLHIYRKFQNVDGAHAMLVVGYDDDLQAVKAVNSWGNDWGNDGFVWIDYKAFTEVLDPISDFKVLCEAWVSTDLVIAPI